MPKLSVLIIFTIISFTLGLLIPRAIFAYHFRRTSVQSLQTTLRIFPSPFLNPHHSLPTPSPKNIPTPLPNVSTSPTPSGVADTSVQSYLLEEINAFRASKGLTAVTAEAYTCNFAHIRAAEIANNFSHDGFQQRINAKTLPYPVYHEVTENIAMTSDYHNVVKLWINSPGHAANMEKHTPHVCVGMVGNYYAYEGWRP